MGHLRAKRAAELRKYAENGPRSVQTNMTFYVFIYVESLQSTPRLQMAHSPDSPFPAPSPGHCILVPGMSSSSISGKVSALAAVKRYLFSTQGAGGHNYNSDPDALGPATVCTESFWQGMAFCASCGLSPLSFLPSRSHPPPFFLPLSRLPPYIPQSSHRQTPQPQHHRAVLYHCHGAL